MFFDVFFFFSFKPFQILRTCFTGAPCVPKGTACCVALVAMFRAKASRVKDGSHGSAPDLETTSNV